MTITALPTPPSRADSANFATRGDAFMAALPTFATEANALADQMNAALVASMAGVTATSASSVEISSSGAKNFTIEAGKGFVIGQTLKAASTADPANYIVGTVTSYSGTALAISATSSGGSGTLASWSISIVPTVSASNGGATTTTSAVDVTLTSSSARVQSINMTAAGKFLILPDATTLTTGGAVFVLAATGASYTVKDGAGNVLQTVAGGQKALVFLTDASTAAGVWMIGALPYSGNTLVSGPATVINAVSSSYCSIAMLSATKAICTYAGTTGYLQAVVLNIVGGGIGITPAAVATINAVSSSYTSVAMLSPTKAICTYSGTTGYLQAVILDVAGSTITPGTVVTINAVNSSYTSVAMLSATKAICAYRGTGNATQAVILDVSGSTITPAAVATINAVAASYHSVAPLSATKAICVYADATNGVARAVILDVSGSTITPGTIVTTNSAGASYTSVAMLSATKAICVCADTTYSVARAVILDVSGSTITPGSPVAFTGGVATSLQVAAVSASKAICTYTLAAGQAIVLEVDGNVPRFGSPISVPAFTGGTNCLVALSANKVLSAFAGTSNYLTSNILDIGVSL